MAKRMILAVASRASRPSIPDYLRDDLRKDAALAILAGGRFGATALGPPPAATMVTHFGGTSPGITATAERRTGQSKSRRMQEAFAAHLRHVSRLYLAATSERVVLILDHAPWHRGKVIDAVLAEHPHLELYRLPSYSPPLHVIERFWRPLRRRVTHNRLFDRLADLGRSLRSSLCYFQMVRERVRRLIAGCYARPKDRTRSAVS